MPVNFCLELGYNSCLSTYQKSLKGKCCLHISSWVPSKSNASYVFKSCSDRTMRMFKAALKLLGYIEERDLKLHNQLPIWFKNWTKVHPYITSSLFSTHTICQHKYITECQQTWPFSEPHIFGIIFIFRTTI